MKKLIVLATAAFLFSGVGFAQEAPKTAKKATKQECCTKDAACCKKDATGKTPACCKKDGAAKVTKKDAPTSAKKG